MSWRPRETTTYQTRSDVVDFRPEIMLDLASQAPPLQERAFQRPPPLPLEATMYRDTQGQSTHTEKRKLSPRSVVDRVMRERFPTKSNQQRSAGITRSCARAGAEAPFDHVQEAISTYAEIEKMQAPLQRRLREELSPVPLVARAPLQRRLRDEQAPASLAARSLLQRHLRDEQAPVSLAARPARPRSAAAGAPPTNQQQSAPRNVLGSSRHLARSSRFW
eukprot:950465-Rhodomonas_salina.2